MQGWIINAYGAGFESHVAERPMQQPTLQLIPPEPGPYIYIFEVWFWDVISQLWFVMCMEPSEMNKRGAVGFHPDTPKEQLRGLRDQWRAYKARYGIGPGGTTGG